MKKLNKLVVAVSVALGMSIISVAGAQMQTNGSDATPTSPQESYADGSNYYPNHRMGPHARGEGPRHRMGPDAKGYGPRHGMGPRHGRGYYGCAYGYGMGPHARDDGPRHGMGFHARGEGPRHRMGPHARGYADADRGGFVEIARGQYMPSDYVVSLITPAEFESYHSALRSATTKEACQQVEADHRKLVTERASSMNVEAPPVRFDVCADLESSGWFSR